MSPVWSRVPTCAHAPPAHAKKDQHEHPSKHYHGLDTKMILKLYHFFRSNFYSGLLRTSPTIKKYFITFIVAHPPIALVKQYGLLVDLIMCAHGFRFKILFQSLIYMHP